MTGKAGWNVLLLRRRKILARQKRQGDIMKRIAQFEKVSFEQFLKDWSGVSAGDGESRIREIYDRIRLPLRATAGSAGYDFFAPEAFSLKAGEGLKIPTGIRVRMEDGWVLKLYPRSGLGFRYRLQLDNTVGIIDGDYYGSDNEGHIQIKVTNDGREGRVMSVAKSRGRFHAGDFCGIRDYDGRFGGWDEERRLWQYVGLRNPFGGEEGRET